jgi:O-antigen/teichoic acid export membrane protein
VQIGYIFILVPILLSQWGVEVYGEWLILSAIASFGALANFGMFQASAVEISLAAGAGDRAGASRIAATALVAGVVFVIAALLLAWIGLSFVDPRTLFGVHTISSRDALGVTVLSLASVVLTVFTPALAAPVNMTIGNAPSTVASALIRVIELIAIAIAVYAGGGPVSVAAVLAGSVCLNILAHVVLVRYWVDWLSFHPRHFDRAVLRRLIRPSLAQFLLYVSINIFIVQVPRIILGHLAGAAAVAVFGVTITYARAARTLAGLFSHSLQTETTRSYAERRHDVFIRLTEALCQVHLWVSLAVLAVMMAFGSIIFSVWTHGKIPFDPWLCLVLGIGFVIGAFSDVVIYVLLGINRILAVAIAHVLATAVAIGLAFPAVSSFGVIGMAAVLIIPEVVVAVVGILVFCDLVSLSRRTFVIKSVQWPVGLVRREADRVMQFWARR